MRHIQAVRLQADQAARCITCKLRAVLWLPAQVRRFEKYETQVRLLLFIWDCRNAITVVSAIVGVSVWGVDHSGH